MTRRQILRLTVGLAALTALAACGKKGVPKPPDPEKSKYPRQYPKPL